MTTLRSPRVLSVKKLFAGEDAWYAIPNYQRPYRWMSEQVEDLWTDLQDAFYNAPKGNYFLGSIITAKQAKQVKGNYVDVIDGQQRLTTLVILFAVIRDFYPEINKNSNDSSAIKISNINASIVYQKKGGRKKPRIEIRERFISGASAASNFKEVVTNPGATKNSDFKRRPSQKDIKGDNPRFNFINSVYCIRRKMEEFGDDLGEFVNFIFNKVQVIRIDCEDNDSAITLFQVLNDRGMDLRSSDLVKSFLLDKISTPVVENSKAFMSDWGNMESHLTNEDKSMTMDGMLIFYMCYILSAAPGEDIFRKFKKRFQSENETSNEILKDFKDFSEKFNDLLQGKQNIYTLRALYALRYTRWDMHWKSILLTAMHLGYKGDDFTKLAQALRRYYYICWIAGKKVSTIETPSFNAIELLKTASNERLGLLKTAPNKRFGLLKTAPNKQSDVINQIDEDLRSFVDDGGSDSILTVAKDKLNSPNVVEKWIKPLLLLIEYNASNDGSASLPFIALDRFLHLEHVLPQAHNDKEWKISKKNSDKYLHSGGNLTLLSMKKNIIASNDGFLAKIDVYRGQGTGGQKSGFRTTQHIVDNWRKWNKTSMHKRKKWFLSEVSKILDLGTWPKI